MERLLLSRKVIEESLHLEEDIHQRGIKVFVE
jgi:hypothetical protein